MPQIGAIIRSFPQVTVVASEHGRLDDGTDPTGFFNAEFCAGLRRYGRWTGGIRTKPALIAAIDRKLSVFPGITFNYTQPADAGGDREHPGRDAGGRDGAAARARDGPGVAGRLVHLPRERGARPGDVLETCWSCDGARRRQLPPAARFQRRVPSPSELVGAGTEARGAPFWRTTKASMP